MIARMLRSVPPLVRWVALPALAAALAFVWWTASPLVLSSRVDEAFPTAAAQPAALADAMPSPEAMADTMASPQPMADAMASPQPMADTMPSPQPMADTMASPQPMADTMPSSEAMADTMAAPEPTAATAPTTAPAEPVALASGGFTRIDRLHWAEGSATIYRLPDGSHLLRLEPFTAQNGPDLYVGLSGHPMPRSHAEAYDTGYVELDRLKANQGNQNYAIPADVDVSAFKSVVIYCKAFSVVFSTATLGG